MIITDCTIFEIREDSLITAVKTKLEFSAITIKKLKILGAEIVACLPTELIDYHMKTAMPLYSIDFSVCSMKNAPYINLLTPYVLFIEKIPALDELVKSTLQAVMFEMNNNDY